MTSKLFVGNELSAQTKRLIVRDNTESSVRDGFATIAPIVPAPNRFRLYRGRIERYTSQGSMESRFTPPKRIRFGLIEVDLRAGELRKKGRRIRLQEQPCQILAALLEHPGEIVTREELYKKLWPDNTFVDFDRSLNTAILRLREALRDSSENHDLIETLPRRGYRFTAHVDDAGASRSENYGFDPENSGSSLRSVVVLPFENLSSDKELQCFADGITDELIARLAKIHSLRVISRTIVMQCKNSHKPLAEIARDLRVDAFVEGTVLSSGNRIRITAELVQVSTERHLWAETYERRMRNSLTLQSQLAADIVKHISPTLAREQPPAAAPFSSTSGFYEDYLKGRYYWNRRSEEGLEKAIKYFQRVTEEHPNYALGHAGLADSYIIGATNFGTVPSNEAASRAKKAALKALEIDATLAEAQISLATVSFNYDRDWPTAASGFENAIERNPSYATAYQRYSLYLIAMGRLKESVDQVNRAREIDPLSISINFSLGRRLYMAREYDRAIEQLRNTLEMDPSYELAHCVLGQAYEQTGQYDAAISELEKALAISHSSPLVISALGHAYAVSGMKEQAESSLTELMKQSKKRYVSPFYVAVIYAGLNEHEKAMDWLEKAYRYRSNGLVFLKVDPDLDSLRSQPRFQYLQRRMHLPA
jgi:TolB-like protein/DNA-binding response OmpR family regulator/Tfp pilus assembly protein PilF